MLTYDSPLAAERDPMEAVMAEGKEEEVVAAAALVWAWFRSWAY